MWVATDGFNAMPACARRVLFLCVLETYLLMGEWHTALVLTKNCTFLSILEMVMKKNKLRDKNICNIWIILFLCSLVIDQEVKRFKVGWHFFFMPCTKIIILEKSFGRSNLKTKFQLQIKSWIIIFSWYGCNKWPYLCSFKNKSNPPTTKCLTIKWKRINI